MFTVTPYLTGQGNSCPQPLPPLLPSAIYGLRAAEAEGGGGAESAPAIIGRRRLPLSLSLSLWDLSSVRNPFFRQFSKHAAVDLENGCLCFLPRFVFLALGG